PPLAGRLALARPPPVARQSEQLQCRANLLSACCPASVQAQQQLQVFQGCKRVVQRVGMADEAQLIRQFLFRLPTYRARERPLQPDNSAKQSRLATSVGAGYLQRLASAQGERYGCKKLLLGIAADEISGN